MAKVSSSNNIEFNCSSAVATQLEQARGLIGLLVDEGASDDHFAIGHERVMSVLRAAETLLHVAEEAAAPLLDAAYARKEAADTAADKALSVVSAEVCRRMRDGAPARRLGLVTEKTGPFLAAIDTLRREGAQNENEEN